MEVTCSPLRLRLTLLKETMTGIYYYSTFAILLACGACSPPGPSTSHDQKATTAVGSSNAAPTSSPPSEEARIIQGQIPAPAAPGQDLKPEYSDKAALIADLEATRPTQAVELDGKKVWKGFGPAFSYRTNGNGSIRR
jgi:hypothetical protein